MPGIGSMLGNMFLNAGKRITPQLANANRTIIPGIAATARAALPNISETIPNTFSFLGRNPKLWRGPLAAASTVGAGTLGWKQLQNRNPDAAEKLLGILPTSQVVAKSNKLDEQIARMWQIRSNKARPLSALFDPDNHYERMQNDRIIDLHSDMNRAFHDDNTENYRAAVEKLRGTITAQKQNHDLLYPYASPVEAPKSRNFFGPYWTPRFDTVRDIYRDIWPGYKLTSTYGAAPKHLRWNLAFNRPLVSNAGVYVPDAYDSEYPPVKSMRSLQRGTGQKLTLTPLGK